MRDVDAISRNFVPLISLYIRTESVLPDTDRDNISDTYTTPLYDRAKAADFLPRLDSPLVDIPVITTKVLLTYRAVIPADVQLLNTTPVTHVLSVSVLLYSHLLQSQL